MSDHVSITKADLRKAIADPRYRLDWMPEHRAWVAWVENGYHALYDSGEAKGGVVKVRAYDRTRDGRKEHVGAHTRSAPPGGLATPAMGPALGEGARRALPMLPRIIGVLPKPSLPLPGWAERLPPLRRPSLLDPPEEGGRRRGTVNGAQRIDIPEAGEQAGPTPGVMENRGPDEGDGLDEYTRPRPPPGSVPIDEGDWSGDHGGIKAGAWAGGRDNVRVAPDGGVWVRNPNGTWTNEGNANDMIGGSRPSGRRGQDRGRNRNR